MQMRLTDLGVKKLSFTEKGQVTHWDATTPGFGIRCSSKRKSYVVMYGRDRRLKTLGRYPDLSLADARKRARLFLATQGLSTDPQADHDYQAVVEAYLEDCRNRLRVSTLEGYVLYLSNIEFSGAIGSITQSDILKGIEQYTQSPSSQNYAFTTFKVFFNWAVRRQYVASNPLNALKRPNRTVSRDRVLSEEELKTLLKFTLGHRGRFHDIVSLLALTGQRKGEVAGLQWSEVDGDTLIFGPDRTKNKREHRVPVCSRAVDLLHDIEGGQIHVFGTPGDDQPYNGWSKAQRRIVEDTGLAHFTLHDLRRTFSTIHAKLGTPIHVTEKLLNHVSGSISGVAAVYNRHSYIAEMRFAVKAYDDYLANLLADC
ncbi:site-specific tyrosine recombinase XerC [Roseovarius gaetbuli]|uniref:Site-specific tyrosine recombinase XerC n=1 Tax=Roseovarius gaetbuli TaxID=1356575 RepID=A0A1X6Y891_9RHOB|nr:site-specific integrase [Roseovarius gaetbuli]SLN13689.1 site-specific tyrosine recombinase XerC [Roseovarius gaetbuli]